MAKQQGQPAPGISRPPVTTSTMAISAKSSVIEVTGGDLFLECAARAAGSFLDFDYRLIGTSSRRYQRRRPVPTSRRQSRKQQLDDASSTYAAVRLPKKHGVNTAGHARRRCRRSARPNTFPIPSRFLPDTAVSEKVHRWISSGRVLHHRCCRLSINAALYGTPVHRCLVVLWRCVGMSDSATTPTAWKWRAEV